VQQTPRLWRRLPVQVNAPHLVQVLAQGVARSLFLPTELSALSLKPWGKRRLPKGSQARRFTLLTIDQIDSIN